MPADPIEVVGQWLQNLLDPDVVSSVVAPAATYASPSTENPELAEIMPWAGTSHGPQAFLGNLGKMFTPGTTQSTWTARRSPWPGNPPSAPAASS
jgi:hypothetical protein